MEHEKMLDILISTIEAELRQQIARLDEPRTQAFHEMLTYHMGWSAEDSGSSTSGKRLRPLLLLLTVQACGTEWLRAAPASAAVELMHNFSLVHDDIQDKSATRRGRPAVWTRWGQAMAINVGDALFVLSNLAVMDLTQSYPAETVTRVSEILFNTCLDLTRGQFLDMSYEERDNLDIEDYWPMIAGKTASLLSSSCQIGSVLGGADQGTQDAYRSFGHALGLAFQIQDDLLGIWGDEAITGKSSASDLLEGKKSLPVLFGLKKNGEFAQRWHQGSIQPEEVEQLAQRLASEGAYEYTYDMADQMTVLAINSLREADPQGEAGEILLDMANNLLKRKQ
jgi:geranylgeranyl diphosphate synthase type I